MLLVGLDDETEFDIANDKSSQTSSATERKSEPEVNYSRRKSKTTLLQIFDPLIKRGEGSRAINKRRKSDCNIILNGELVAVGWRRNSATIKICNQALTQGNETVF